MKKISSFRVAAAVAAAAAFSFSSCTYDPYYSSAGGYYGSSYGEGYGYGGSGFSTSLFVGTGDPRWGYDPYCYSYYDYSSHRYYDPYLYGYYPIGYRPPIVIGAPHPYGWHPGRSYCPPPRNVRNVAVVNYRNRESAYRSSNYSWANQVRVEPNSRGRVQGQTTSRSSYGNPSTYNRNSPYGGASQSSRRAPYNSATPSTRSSFKTEGNYNPPNRSRAVQPQGVSPDSRPPGSNRVPSNYNTPTGAPSRQYNNTQRTPQTRNQSTPQFQPSSQGRTRGGGSQPIPSTQPRGGDRNSRDSSNGDSNKDRKIRSLGQG